MADLTSPLVEILLTSDSALILQLNDRLAPRVVHNAPLLVEWRGHGRSIPVSLQLLLEELLPSPHAGEMLQQISVAAPEADAAGIALGTCELHAPQGGAPARYVAVSLHRAADSARSPLLLLMRDVTAMQGLQHSLTRTRQLLDAALAVLRAPPQAMRQFLAEARTAVAGLRALMKRPARDQAAVHAKLAQLLQDSRQLGDEAAAAGLGAITQACADFGQRVALLQGQPEVRGDELLSLAPLLDQVAMSVGDAQRIEEQRHREPATQPVADAKEA
jgi:hypothetical protein